MSEMLGNQYFMARKYSEAAAELESVLLSDPKNKSAQKKLIICYSQIKKIDQSFDIFYSLLMDDADTIIDTHAIHDDCPCPELIPDLESRIDFSNETAFSACRTLGTLWLYCDIHKSLEYFQKCIKIHPDDKKIKNTIKILIAKIEERVNNE